MDSYNSPTTKSLFKGTQIVWYVLGLLETLMVFRFILKLLAANAGAGFTGFIYGTTNIFVVPFNNVFRLTRVDGNIFEWTTLLSMLVYWLVATAIFRLFLISKTVSTGEAAVKLNNQE